MTYEEIINKVNEKISRAGLRKSDIASELQINAATLINILGGKSCLIYLFLDLLDEVGLELILNNKTPVTKHQDLIDYIDALDYDRNGISGWTSISISTIRKIEKGDNVQTAKVLIVMNVIGINVKVV